MRLTKKASLKSIYRKLWNDGRVGIRFCCVKNKAVPPNLPVAMSPEQIQALQGLPFKIDVNILKMGWERALR